MKNAARVVVKPVSPSTNVRTFPVDMDKAKLEAMAEEIARLKAEIAARKAGTGGTLTLKLQDSPRVDKSTGEVKEASFAISLYGLGRFPVTLYREQWEKLMAFAPSIADFIEANKGRIPAKDEKAKGKPAMAQATQTEDNEAF